MTGLGILEGRSGVTDTGSSFMNTSGPVYLSVVVFVLVTSQKKHREIVRSTRHRHKRP